MTSPSPSSDRPPGLVTVEFATALGQGITRAARPADRARFWEVFAAALESAKETTRLEGHVMPWETPDTITTVTWPALTRVLKAALLSVPEGQRAHLIDVGKEVCTQLETSGTPATPLPVSRFGIRRCAHCGRAFAPVSATHVYCTGHGCRQNAYRARKHATVAMAST